MTEKIRKFSDEFRFLSNFWPAEVELDGITYPTVEHAYVAAKTVDKQLRAKVLDCSTPGHVKRFGKTLKLRKGWDDMRVRVMRDLIRKKFVKGSDLGNMLVATGDRQIEEGNTWGDTFWGKCDGFGKNYLGRILMQVRKEIS